MLFCLTDLSDGGDLAGGNSSVPGSESSPRSGALNYSSALNATSNSNAALVSQNSASMSSTETLLLNIQELLKVAADNARQKERQINYEKGKFLIYCYRFQVIAPNYLSENFQIGLLERAIPKK